MITLNEEAKQKASVTARRGAFIINKKGEAGTSVWYFDFPRFDVDEGEEFSVTITGKVVNGELCQT